RTHNCGELRLKNLDQQVTLSGWVQKSRNKGFMLWIDLRDRFGVSQLIFDEHRSSKELFEKAKKLGREFVIQVKGSVIERTSKNPNIATGEIEILVSELTVLNESLTPPFTIEDKTDGGEELRMKYRYLDIRRNSIKEKLIFRHKVSSEIRNYLTALDFIDVETPYLIKSTPEGARDFVVPSRMNQGEFYALPQSPQTFKQLLMVGGIDKYFQIVKCFRDEDLRADRQPEFTQIDCEMSFVNQEDILNTFEGLVRHLLSSIKNINVDDFPRMTYDQAMSKYGCDKPDIRFGMELGNLNEVSKHKEFNVFNSSELVVGIAVPNGNTFTRKQIDSYTNWVKRPQIGAKGLVYARCNDDGSFKSSVDKFYDQEDLGKWANITGAVKGDLIFILSGEVSQVRAQISALRLEVAENLNLRKSDEFAPLWVTDFPLLEWNVESQKYHAMHHPFTSPKLDQLDLLEKSPEKVKANAYDLVLNGNEIGGGSIRIHDKKIQALMFKHLGFSEAQAKEQFGFLMNAFEYGAPPHGGIALGLDRLVAILHGEESIKDYIAFPKNNSGKDVMIDAPSKLDDMQLNELSLKLKSNK
ncbi:MAG: aspartate--tRNA ligase, partial [Flavobacteriaceae bacterium]|nr:aspartate--tRNA ligase [Flavobacteriaceae bacterium]